MQTTLQRKTPLRAKTGLKTYKPLKAKSSLRDSYAAKVKSGEKKIKVSNKSYRPKYKYFSIFTDDLDMCYISGSTKASGEDIHIHHIFGAANKKSSEKYGFILPLRADWHNMSDYGIHFDRELDVRMRRKCQDYWLKHYGTQEEFIQVFGKWW